MTGPCSDMLNRSAEKPLCRLGWPSCPVTVTSTCPPRAERALAPMHLVYPDPARRTGTLAAEGHEPIPCLAGSSDTPTSRDDPATLSCLSHQSRQIALKKSRHLPLKVTAMASRSWCSTNLRSRTYSRRSILDDTPLESGFRCDQLADGAVSVTTARNAVEPNL